ncbi:MAG: hypothetical protein JST52_06790 [Bacteroidetes bacterium]|nr:hypothetical protein [Bacteroidota bacterium]MBS1740165.1 hypothetical protein [Bacteroidota bacterium]MBS1776794.1 hypothetical protein [Bacteroidota bacterium]
MRNNHPLPSRSNKALFGVIIVLIGAGLFLEKIGLLPHFDFEITWPLVLIVIGLLIGVRNRFSTPAPYILLAIGVFNLIPAFTFHVGDKAIDSEDIVMPLLVMLGGLFIILKPRKKKSWMDMKCSTLNDGQTVNANVVFGGRKEIVTSKNFNGGKVTANFGGAEINLLQAESENPTMILEVQVSFGGCEIIIPSDWDVKNEVETVLGSVEDKRHLRQPESAMNKKTLVLRGSVFCGGIEIKSY